MVNAIFAAPPPPEEEKNEPPPPAREEKKRLPGLPRCVAITMPTCNIRQVQAAAALMGLPKRHNSQFIFFRQKSNSSSTMIVSIPSLIAAGIATAVVTGGITGTAVYLTSGDTDVVTGDQFKTEG
jgi:hypothetical protein